MDLASVIEMKTDKILLCVSDLDRISEYKKLGISNFLFPLKKYCVGYNDFSFDEIKNIDGNVYILMNRLLTDNDIDDFITLDIPSNVNGFVVEDIGLLEVIDKKYKIINFENHLNNNYETINIMLRDFDSLVISSDITKEEITAILERCNKPLVLNTFGKQMVMYSRRYLVSNYLKHYDKNIEYSISIEEKVFKNKFDLVENDYGTAVFNHEYTDYRNLVDEIDDSKILFYLIDTNFLQPNSFKDVLDKKVISNTTEGFLNKKTIYKVGEKND